MGDFCAIYLPETLLCISAYAGSWAVFWLKTGVCPLYAALFVLECCLEFLVYGPCSNSHRPCPDFLPPAFSP
jgi:hypothetical protein